MKELILQRFSESGQIKRRFGEENWGKIGLVVDSIVKAIERGNKILFFGNGGSASQAQHLASEFVNRFLMERNPLPALALTTDTSVLTSIANDYEFSQVFSKQILALGKAGDIAIGLSTSGNSENLLVAFKVAKEMDIITIGILGRDGGRVSKIVEHSLVVPSQDIARIQETHLTLGHILCELIEKRLFGRSP